MKLPIAESDYQEWKHHPVSKVFLQYLADYRAALLRDHLQEWEARAIDQLSDLERRGRVMALADLAELPFSAMEFFYATPEEESEPDAA